MTANGRLEWGTVAGEVPHGLDPMPTHEPAVPGEVPFTNLVFEGGGAKGIAYAGALQALDGVGILPAIAAVAGSSAGAIAATLVALGFSAAEYTATMLSLDMSRFEDGLLGGPVRLVERYGWCRGDTFHGWMGSHVAARLGSPSATFADLLTERHVDLRVVATNLSSHGPEIFSAATTPDLPLADAVRMSMSIPFYFAAVQTGGHVYVDGGATWNYPVEIFDDNEVNWATLGFRFDRPTPRPPAEINDLVGFTTSLVESLIDVQAGHRRRNHDHDRRTVVIDHLGIKATDFKLTEAQRFALIAQGEQATNAYLAAHPLVGPRATPMERHPRSSMRGGTVSTQPAVMRGDESKPEPRRNGAGDLSTPGEHPRPGDDPKPSSPEDGVVARAFIGLTGALDRRYRWDHLPLPVSLATLIGLRMTLRRHNLFDPSGTAVPWGPTLPPPGSRPLARASDGTGNDLHHPEMGGAGMPFTRNIPIYATYRDDVLKPNLRTISLELLARRRFIPARTLNLLAAAWLQFEIHDWMSHGANDVDDPWEVDLADDDPWPEHPMRIQRTHADPPEGGPLTFRNTETHWWDASQIYGSSPLFEERIRTGKGGRLQLNQEGVIAFDPANMAPIPGVDTTAMSSGWWIGLAMLHTLFMREHNSICDHLAAAYPTWSDDELFNHARLINAALIAKIHMVEWTPALLADTQLRMGMNANWWGFQGEHLKRRFGPLTKNEEVSGIPGSRTYHHGLPYAMTEEFVEVYRMHPLIPDDFSVRSWTDDQRIEDYEFPAVAGVHTHEVLASQRLGMPDLFYSFGTSHPGAIVLHNYPRHLQQYTQPDGTLIDLAAIDILRTRERGVPRYNEFRRKFRLAPASKFEDFSDDPAVVEDLRAIYGDPEAVDLMIGLYAERPPDGFAFSDTAFRVFVLMASRRVKSDRFFTYDYRPEVYTPEGMRWVETNTMSTVLLRHFPHLTGALGNVNNAFAPWHKAGGN